VIPGSIPGGQPSVTLRKRGWRSLPVPPGGNQGKFSLFGYPAGSRWIRRGLLLKSGQCQIFGLNSYEM
jgi:hypothetical protein